MYVYQNVQKFHKNALETDQIDKFNLFGVNN